MKKREMVRLFILIATIALIAVLTACGAGSIDLSGNWSGSNSGLDARGDNYTETMVWDIVQAGNQIEGTELLTGEGYSGQATVSGTLDGAVLTFSVSGEYDEPYDGCEYTISGEAEITDQSIDGSYDGTSSCEDGTSNSASGTFTLNKE